MSLRFAYTDGLGRLCLVQAAPKEALAPLIGVRQEDGSFLLSDEDFRARVIARSLTEQGVSTYVELDAQWSPPDADRAFRDAWALDGETVTVDMAAARAIHRDRLRAVRRPLLEALDVAYLRADEAGDAQTKADVAGAKQDLRDITDYPAIDAATTPAELRAAWPEELSPSPY